MNIRLSIIIPTYKRFQSLQKTLYSVQQNRIEESEVLVIDQSPDNSENSKKIQVQYPFVQYICCNTPGLPQARNIGIMKSIGSILCFIDDDVIVHSSCFKEHMLLHSKKNIDAIAGRIVQKNKHYAWESISTVAVIDYLTGETKGNFDLDYTGNVLFATGGHMSIKRTVFHTVGLFNQRFYGNALYEDVEFFFRMRKKGFTIHYNPLAIIYHYPLETGGCHNSKGYQYYLERLHNQTLFFLLHISLFPPISYSKYCKNLIEYISRNKNKTYSVKRVFLCILILCKAYSNAILSILYTPKLRQKQNIKE